MKPLPPRLTLHFPPPDESNVQQWGCTLVAQMVKNPPATQETKVSSLGGEDLLEEEMATHCSILAWEIPWTEKPGGLQSMGLQGVGHDLAIKPPTSKVKVPATVQRTWGAQGEDSASESSSTAAYPLGHEWPGVHPGLL